MKHWEAISFGICLGMVPLFVYACTARETAKDAYTIQSKACVQIYDGDAPAQRSCLEYVRNKWTKAGAPPAAVDGGVQ